MHCGDASPLGFGRLPVALRGRELEGLAGGFLLSLSTALGGQNGHPAAGRQGIAPLHSLVLRSQKQMTSPPRGESAFFPLHAFSSSLC